MGRIRILPDTVINTIAAGEVVERPASVAKELIENALDAGAGSIVLRIEDGGRRLVEVLDDGCGMDADDAVAAFDRHATSKLPPDRPIELVETLGFRGEALPSIAAVSRMTLTSGTGREATRVEVEGGRIVSAAPATHPAGTTVCVRDLFFNTPARRRFLRATSTETGHLLELFTALALSRPDVRFRLTHGKRRLFDLPPAEDLRSRLGQMEGPEAHRAAAELALDQGGIRISGFVLAGEASRQQKARRLVVNGRVVRDRLLLGSISRAADECLPSGTPLTCLVVVSLPPEQVDVNVHPAKAEVRFREPGAVFRLVREAVAAALGGRRPIRTGPAPLGDAPGLDDHRERIIAAAGAWARRRPDAGSTALWRPQGGGTALSEESLPAVSEPAAPRGQPVVIGHYRSGYILAEDDEGLLIVDQHAAHERILFEQLSDGRAGGGPLQSLLFPRTVQAPSALRGDLDSLASDLNDLGFETEPFGDGTLVVRGMPAILAEADPESIVLGILSEGSAGGGTGEGLESRRRRMLATTACHAAVKVPAHLTDEKIAWILARLLECRSPLRCPHGRPTLLRWGHRELERRFGRP